MTGVERLELDADELVTEADDNSVYSNSQLCGLVA